MTTEYVKKIEGLYLQYFEKTINSMLSSHPQFDGYANKTIIIMQDDVLQAEIKRRNKYFDKARMTEYQKEEYDKALVYQLHYVLNEGDFSSMSGYDVVTNTFASQKEMESRVLAQMAKTILTNAGLMCRVIGGSDSYWERRRRF